MQSQNGFCYKLTFNRSFNRINYLVCMQEISANKCYRMKKEACHFGDVRSLKKLEKFVYHLGKMCFVARFVLF